MDVFFSKLCGFLYLVLFFMSRNHIEKGQITLHPSGLPHGPHPGAYERSIGKKATDELAVMIDTFKPLQLTTFAMGIEDSDYSKSWLPL